ncbi:CBS domain-containing protein [Amycolatopsis balhimycina DSM 5908]|uniref:CBS domain-containing protein n=1 Tax=Amycolatopsis balhimycina DSM 5908 TaxID=1081091 RepID=A0A428W4Z2_AMYBA|nr:CBS domain-containing protein [Amycolatopsis balhimycina]RSM38140.1 CBS domain-containing protein [Amycolatopsis balhimycina DSM 5908]
MRARDLMTAPVITVHPWTSAKEAAELLAAHGFTALPVVDDDDRLIGIVTEADLIRGRIPVDPRHAHEHHEAAPAGKTVGDLMTSPVTAMSTGTDVVDLCQALVDARIRAMPIVDGSAVVGIVTRGDIVRVLAREDVEIARDVKHRLEIYGGSGRWQVDVHDGLVHITDQFDDDTDRHVAQLLALAVPGVVAAETAYAGEEQTR